jgi:membrane protein YdbS with pleckstrin-like domain
VAAIVASVFWTLELDLPGVISFAVGAAGCLLAGLVPLIRYRRWRYEIRRRDVFLSRGALFHVMTLIPFDRIQFVETRQGPLDRLFRLTQVVIYTAAGRAGQIPGLNRSEAESIREELSLVAGAATV